MIKLRHASLLFCLLGASVRDRVDAPATTNGVSPRTLQSGQSKEVRKHSNPWNGKPTAYHWHFEGLLHGVPMTAEAWLTEDDDHWDMVFSTQGGHELKLGGTWRRLDDGALDFTSQFADAHMVFETVPGALNNLPGPLGKHRWQVRSSNVDVRFDVIEPVP